MIKAPEAQSRGLFRRLAPVVFVALALRLVVMGFAYSPEVVNPERHHWYFAGEVGQIAGSLFEGKGYSSPFFADTGPTAWLVPIYPWLLCLVFDVFGEYTKASAIALYSLNCLFSALTCLPVFFITKRSFGERAALRAAWVWAFFPYSIYFAATFMWSTALITLLLPIAFLAGLELEDSVRPRAWIGFGLLSGIAAMTDPVVMTVLPPVGLWMCYRAWRRKSNWLRLSLGAVIAVAVVVAPWFIRNYQVFHKVVPFRNNFGHELYLGNNGDTSQWLAGYLQPAHSEREWQSYRQLGEVGYMQQNQRQAMEFISKHKALFLWTSVRRAIYMWTNFWSFDRDYLREEPFDIPAIFLNTTMTVLALWGLWIGWKELGAAIAPYAIALFCFPVVYYVTHPEDRYRRPADTFFVVLAIYAVTAWRQHKSGRRISA
jgi:4-amino-4-deoxy-L-arabinose transferase-like glycosyltransferase